MKKSAYASALLIFMVCCLFLPGEAPAQGPPPALVVVAPAAAGKIAPQSEFVGTVHFKVVSDVAAEVGGKVAKVSFEEGDKVAGGSVLVRLDSALLEKSIASMEASHAQAAAEMTSAELEFKRIEPLYEQELASGSSYDDARLRAVALNGKADSLKAGVEGLKVELAKKEVRAPFDGVVLQRFVDKGEWVDSGGRVATIAAYDEVDITVNVPQEIMTVVRPGMKAAVKAGGRSYTGKVVAVVPSGDVKTRTFPVKVRVKNDSSFAEGMGASVSLPNSVKVDAFIVPRDAITSKFGATVVFAAVEGKAKMIPVEVVGYSGASVGVLGEGLKDGTAVVVKGNERLNDGQPVNIAGSK